MEIENQEKVWDKIASEWHEYKKIPSEGSRKFLENCKSNVLDLGGGSGRHLTKIKDGKYYLQDISSEMVRLAEKKAKDLGIEFEGVHSSMEKIPFSDEFFDFILCTHSLYCLKNNLKRDSAVNEMYRVLKKEGKMLISVWNRNSKRFKKGIKEKFVSWGNKGKRYYYLYEKNELSELLTKTGFKIIQEIPSEVNITFIVEK